MLLSKFVAIGISAHNNNGWFQSLFFWMLLSKFGIYIIGFIVNFGFQSLFFWMLLSKSDTVNCTGVLRTAVSILIFLDASL